MSEPESKKIVLPAYPIRRPRLTARWAASTATCCATSCNGKTYDFDPWQFFRPGSAARLRKPGQVAGFRDRFDRDITQQELETLFSAIADQKLFEESARSIRCWSSTPSVRSR